jgi:hypothetical protein
MPQVGIRDEQRGRDFSRDRLNVLRKIACLLTVLLRRRVGVRVASTRDVREDRGDWRLRAALTPALSRREREE